MPTIKINTTGPHPFDTKLLRNFTQGERADKIVRLAFCTSLLLTITLTSTATQTPHLNESAFFKQVHSAYNEFKQKDRSHRYFRYACYGLLGAGLCIAWFRNAFPSPSPLQEQWLVDKVRELARAQPPAHEKPPVIAPAAPSRGFFKSMLYGTVGLAASFFTFFIRDGLLTNLAYGLVGPIVEPMHRFMNSHRTLLSGDIWLLREQVRESKAPFVLVSMDLSDFIDELKAWELEMQYILALLTTTPPDDASPLSSLLAEAQDRICLRVARILGHIMYMRDKTSSYERLTMEVLYTALQSQLETATNTWAQAYASDDATARKQATEAFQKSLRSILLPLLSVSLYRIHPWPASVACSDYARLCVTSVVAGYGNPLVPQPQ